MTSRELITCPYCGHQTDDAWEFGPEIYQEDRITEIECTNEDCEREFLVTCETTREFISSKKNNE